MKEIEQIYKSYFILVYRFFYYKFLSKDIAEDLTSETFEIFLTALNNNKEIENNKNMLLGIAKNVFMKALREKYKKMSFSNYQSLDEIEDITAFVESADQKDPVDIIKKILVDLPDKQKEIISLRLVEKLTPKEIAKRLNKDSNYVFTTQRRAVKSLRDLIIKYFQNV